MRYVIVGGGIAGTTAAEELRKLDDQAEITIVSEEPHRLYSRVLLPHYVKGKIPRERVFLKKPEWYGEQNIELLTNVSVKKLDPNNAFVGLSDGRELPYDKLLIATGGDVRTMPEDVRGVSYFRGLDDTDHMVQLLSERTNKTRGGIYGGGFIACEYLNIFRHFEIPTTIAFRGPYFWSRIFGEESGELLNDHLRQHGVTVHVGETFEKLGGEKELRGFVTDKQEIPCEILGVGIGIAPDLSWVKEAGVEVGSGIKANEFLETNAPNVYTAGDVAEFYDTVTERTMHIGNWMNAMMQGRTVAKTMFGDRNAFQLVSSYATNALDLEMIFVGDTSREAADEVVVRGSHQEKGVTQLFVRNKRLVGATMVNRNTDRTPITNLIKAKTDISAHLEKWKDLSESISA